MAEFKSGEPCCVCEKFVTTHHYTRIRPMDAAMALPHVFACVHHDADEIMAHVPEPPRDTKLDKGGKKVPGYKLSYSPPAQYLGDAEPVLDEGGNPVIDTGGSGRPKMARNWKPTGLARHDTACATLDEVRQVLSAHREMADKANVLMPRPR